jgi:DNA invertase Pin-like site-specific DNA recombinase
LWSVTAIWIWVSSATIAQRPAGVAYETGIAQARSEGGRHGRPKTAALRLNQIRKLKRQGLNHSQIARTLHIGRTSVRRLLTPGPELQGS